MKIKTHTIGKTYIGHHFFILSKGLNAGKPLNAPCPNCFVLFADDETEKEMYYWICFGLWQGSFFRSFLSGSVIPFMRINDLKQIIEKTFVKTEMKKDEFKDAMQVLNKLSAHQENIIYQMHLIKQAKKSLIYKVL